MNNERGEAAVASEASANRRWMIGIAITVVFGGFGAVMAWLSYARRDRAPPAPAASSAAPATAPSTPDRAPGREPRDRGNGRKDR